MSEKQKFTGKKIVEALNEGMYDLAKFKRYKGTKFVFEENGKIVHVDPEEIIKKFEK